MKDPYDITGNPETWTDDMSTDTSFGKPVNEPNHVAVDLYFREARMVNGCKHSTIRKGEIRVVDARGKTVCTMEERDQNALDTAWLIARMLDREAA